MLRLIRADLLKLRRRRGMVARRRACSCFGVRRRLLGAGARSSTRAADFDERHRHAHAARLGGGRDHRRHRRRRRHRVRRLPRPRGHRPLPHRAVLLARARGLGRSTLAMLARRLIVAALRSSPVRRRRRSRRGAGQRARPGALTAAVCVGLAALTGRAGPSWASRSRSSSASRRCWPSSTCSATPASRSPPSPISRLDGAEGLVAALPLVGAIGIILAWAAAAPRRRPLANPHPGDLDSA